jgi:hypothetical protein
MAIDLPGSAGTARSAGLSIRLLEGKGLHKKRGKLAGVPECPFTLYNDREKGVRCVVGGNAVT